MLLTEKIRFELSFHICNVIRIENAQSSAYWDLLALCSQFGRTICYLLACRKLARSPCNWMKLESWFCAQKKKLPSQGAKKQHRSNNQLASKEKDLKICLFFFSRVTVKALCKDCNNLSNTLSADMQHLVQSRLVQTRFQRAMISIIKCLKVVSKAEQTQLQCSVLVLVCWTFYKLNSTTFKQKIDVAKAATRDK